MISNDQQCRRQNPVDTSGAGRYIISGKGDRAACLLALQFMYCINKYRYKFFMKPGTPPILNQLGCRRFLPIAKKSKVKKSHQHSITSTAVVEATRSEIELKRQTVGLQTQSQDQILRQAWRKGVRQTVGIMRTISCWPNANEGLRGIAVSSSVQSLCLTLRPWNGLACRCAGRSIRTRSC
jgi:hypothetical protein